VGDALARVLEAAGGEAAPRARRKLAVAAVKATFRFTARGEVILAAGAIGSPRILQLSGIGPAEVLAAAGVPLPVLAGRPVSVKDLFDVAGFPTTGASAARTAMAGRTINGGASMLTTTTTTTTPPHLIQQLMVLAGWTTRSPWLQNHASMSPRGSPSSFSSGRFSDPRGMPSTFAYRTPGASSGRVIDNGAVAGRGKQMAGTSRSLEIIAVDTGAGSSKNASPAGGHANSGVVVKRLAPVLAMPSAGAAGKGKEEAAAAAPSPNGRGRKRAPPKVSNDPAAGSDKKPRKRAKKAPAAGSKVTVPADVIIVDDDVNQPSSNTDAQSNADDDLKKAAVASPAATRSKTRSKRKTSSNSAAASPSARSSAIAARKKNNATATGTTATPPPPAAKKHTVLTWLIDTGFLKDKAKVFYVPGDAGAAEKVISGMVTKTGIRCRCCNTVVPVAVFETHARCERPGQPWEKLLLMSGKPLSKCMQEAWAQERVTAMRAREKAMASLEQEKEKSSQAKRKLAKTKKMQLLDGVVVVSTSSPRHQVKKNGGGKDCSDDACGVCADGGQLLVHLTTVRPHRPRTQQLLRCWTIRLR